MSRASQAAIVVPCIGIDPLVVKCVEACARLCDGAEIIVVSDQDEGADKLGGKARVIASGNVRIGAKRNLGVRATDRRYVAFIDSDAFPNETWLERGIELLEAHPKACAATGPNVSPHEQGETERWVGLAAQSRLVTRGGHFLKVPAKARELWNAPSCNLVLRRDEYLAVGGMDETLDGGEDLELCLKLTRGGRPIQYAPDVLVFHKNRHLRAFVNQRIAFGAFYLDAILRRFHPRLLVGLLPAAFLVTSLAAPFVRVLSSPVLALWSVYGVVVAIETLRLSRRVSDVPGVAAALCVGSLGPGVGVIGRVLRLLPEMRRFYRNDR